MKYERLNLLTVESNAVIAHGVNCLGVMGAGVALPLKNRYPVIMTEYKRICAENTPDEILGTIDIVPVGRQLFVCNIFTQPRLAKFHGERIADAQAIKNGIDDLFFTMFTESYTLPVYMPKIGCGFGGLRWDELEESIAKSAKIWKTNLTICEI